jgi:hypothetical protein
MEAFTCSMSHEQQFKASHVTQQSGTCEGVHQESSDFQVRGEEAEKGKEKGQERPR